MQYPDEILDVVNERDEVVGRGTRREVHECRLRHRAVHVLLFDERNQLFVQKRSAAKDTFPLCYDSSASGHLSSGEDDDDCAERELREELGLEIRHDQLNKHFKIAACSETGWEFVWVYSVRGAFSPIINPTEIVEGAFWEIDAVRRLVVEHPKQCAPSFCRVFREFDTRGLLSSAAGSY